MTDAKQERLPGLDSSGIIRVEKRERWLTIENETVRDKRLTFGARGLLTYLLSHADKWEIKVPHLIKQSPAGREAIYTLLRELEKFRYLIRKQRRGHKGRYHWLSVVYETPQGPPMTDEELRQLRGHKRKKKQGDGPALPFTGKPYMDGPDTVEPDTDKPDTGEPDTVEPDTDKPDDKRNLLLTEESSTEESRSEGEQSSESGAHASSSESSEEKMADDEAAEILSLYTRATRNQPRESDRLFLDSLRHLPVQLIKAGVALSAIRAGEAGTKINSLRYCQGAIEELSAPEVLPSYLEYVLNKFEQLYPPREGES